LLPGHADELCKGVVFHGVGSQKPRWLHEQWGGPFNRLRANGAKALRVNGDQACRPRTAIDDSSLDAAARAGLLVRLSVANVVDALEGRDARRSAFRAPGSKKPDATSCVASPSGGRRRDSSVTST
jgi:hypothetical protein